MKKLVSLFAVCAMLLTVLCAVPAQAAPYAEYPYVYEDLEAGAPSDFYLMNNSTGATHGRVADPTERSGYVYKVNIAPREDVTYSFVDAAKVKDIPIVMGTTMKASLMVYMANGTPRTNNVSIVYNVTGTTLTPEGEKSEQTFNGWFEQPGSVNWTVGEWTKIENTVTWSKSLAYGVSGATPLGENTVDFDSIKIYRILFRIGAGNNKEFIVDNTKLNEGADNLEFYYDEMTYEPVALTNVEELEYGKNLFTYGDFSNNATTGFYSHNDAGQDKKMVASLKTGRSPVDGNEGTYLNMANPDGAFAWNELEYIGGEHANIRYLPNRMYEFRFWYRVNEMYDADGTCGYNPAVSTEPAYADVYFKWGVGTGTTPEDKLDLNGLWGSSRWPTGKYPHDNLLVLDGEWHQASIFYRFDSKTFAEPLMDGKPFRTRIIFQAHQSNMWKPMHTDIDLDDIQMIDHGPITNGDFETGSGYAVRWVNSQGTGATASNTGYGVFGWLPDGCTLAQSDEVRANPDTGSTKSMQVTLNAGGRPLQALSLDKSPTNRYKLSFWAKDANLADGESVPFAVVLDRSTKVTEPQAAEIYKVPDYEFYFGKNEKVSGGWVYNKNVMETQSWKLTNEWQYFETYISNEFPVKEGMENASTKFILPRQPFMFFLYNGSNPAGATYYLDDVKLENAPAEAPVAENFTVNGVADPGKKVSVSYDFVNPLGADEGESIVRVYANGASIGSFKARGGSFEIPETAIGKALTFELLPIDANGAAGEAISTMNAETTCDWSAMYMKNYNAVKVYAGESVVGKMIFASYCGNQLLDVKALDVDIKDGGNQSVTAEDLVLEGATRVKVMFWNDIASEKPILAPEEAVLPSKE